MNIQGNVNRVLGTAEGVVQNVADVGAEESKVTKKTQTPTVTAPTTVAAPTLEQRQEVANRASQEKVIAKRLQKTQFGRDLKALYNWDTPEGRLGELAPDRQRALIAQLKKNKQNYRDTMNSLAAKEVLD